MPPEPEPRPGRSTAAAISDAVVGLWRDYSGRGPTRARTTIAADMIIVTLRDTLTRSERALAQHGRTAEVLAMRRAVQHAMSQDVIAAIEALTGRAVDGFLADSLLDPDITVAIFLLRPSPSDTAITCSE